jgi:hypothetical protein
MRQIYTSPHQENIDRLSALLTEHGIENSISNRSKWKRPGYQRFSYTQQRESRNQWPQVWVERADDYTRARELLRELGLEPMVRYGDELAAARNPSPATRQSDIANRARRIALLAVAGAFVVLMLRYMHVL